MSVGSKRGRGKRQHWFIDVNLLRDGADRCRFRYNRKGRKKKKKKTKERKKENSHITVGGIRWDWQLFGGGELRDSILGNEVEEGNIFLFFIYLTYGVVPSSFPGEQVGNCSSSQEKNLHKTDCSRELLRRKRTSKPQIISRKEREAACRVSTWRCLSAELFSPCLCSAAVCALCILCFLA